MPCSSNNTFNTTSSVVKTTGEQYFSDLAYAYQCDTADTTCETLDYNNTNCTEADLQAGVRQIGYISDSNCSVRFDSQGNVYRVNEALRDTFWPGFAHPRSLPVRQLYSADSANTTTNSANSCC